MARAINDAKTPAQQRQEATRILEFPSTSDGECDYDMLNQLLTAIMLYRVLSVAVQTAPGNRKYHPNEMDRKFYQPSHNI